MSYEFQSTLVDVTANFRIAGNHIGGVRIEQAGDIKVARVIRTTDADVRFALSGPYELGDPDAIYAALSADLYEVASGVLINEGAIGSVEHDASQIIIDLKGSDRVFIFKRSEDAEQVDPIETADRRWILPQASFDSLKAAAAIWRSSVDGELESLSSAITAEAAARVAADDAEVARVDALIASGMWLFADQAAFPPAADNHGRVVHSHADAAIFFAHGGIWHQVAKEVDLQTTIASVDNEATARDAADNALDARIDVLEADPTTQTLLDAEETAREAADAGLSGRLDTLEADPTTQAALDAVIADVDQNESDSDAADAALSGRLDILEVDPTTKTYVDTADALKLDASSVSVYGASLIDDADAAAARTTLGLGTAATTASSDYATAAQGALADTAVQPAAISNVDNTSDADKPVSTAQQAALDLKAPLADPDFTGVLEVDTNARLEFDSNLTKLHNVLRSTSIVIGNNITLNPAAADGRVEVEGEFYLRPSDLTNAADDTAAAAAGVIVGQVYRNGSQLMVRVA
jgi:hypothetical protein